jgi:hypothetical protein
MNHSLNIRVAPFLRGAVIKRGAVFGGILVAALLAFELFNYATTAFALSDVLGDLASAGIRWSTVLALAFCGIDFAGIARLFTPQQGRDEPAEVWYLFGAWLLAAGFNATLTWWGVSVAIMHHTSQGGILVGQATVARAVPVLVAVMVWLIRVLIIGTFSLAGDSMFSIAETQVASNPSRRPNPGADPARSYPRPLTRPIGAMRPVAHASAAPGVLEPTYHPVVLSAQPPRDNPALRR